MTTKPFHEDIVRCRGKMFRPGRLTAFTMILLAAATIGGNARADTYPVEARRAIVDATLKSAVPPELALAVARVGAGRRSQTTRLVGVMQVLPSVAREEFGIQPQDLWRRRANIGLGVALLERL